MRQRPIHPCVLRTDPHIIPKCIIRDMRRGGNSFGNEVNRTDGRTDGYDGPFHPPDWNLSLAVNSVKPRTGREKLMRRIIAKQLAF